jgi:hypothetical protein
MQWNIQLRAYVNNILGLPYTLDKVQHASHCSSIGSSMTRTTLVRITELFMRIISDQSEFLAMAVWRRETGNQLFELSRDLALRETESPDSVMCE